LVPGSNPGGPTTFFGGQFLVFFLPGIFSGNDLGFLWFAEMSGQCDNGCMHKSFTTAMNILAAGMLLGNALAQQTPAATTPPASPSPASSAKAQTSAAKAHSATAAKTPVPLTLKTQKDKFSYALGMKMGQNLGKQSVPVDPAILARGLRDGLAGGKTLLTDEEAQAALKATQDDLRAKQQAKTQQAEEATKKVAEVNKKEGETFLAENKAKDGVVTLASGMQYKILKEGTGPKPTTSDSVVCNYQGTLINGKEFDSSYKRGQPATFPVTGVIKGWTEALQLMPVGSKWQLFIPSDLAYGDRGAGADIGPGATLVFEVELLSIEDKSKDAAPEKGEEKK
jgi:FKBP-type peptidyl-prolyl cis-trans isomerase FklB